MPFYVLVLKPNMSRFERLFDDSLQGGISLSDSERLGGEPLPTVYSSTISINSFISNAVLYFLVFMVESILRFTTVAIGAMNQLEVNNLFDSLSARTKMGI